MVTALLTHQRPLGSRRKQQSPTRASVRGTGTGTEHYVTVARRRREADRNLGSRNRYLELCGRLGNLWVRRSVLGGRTFLDLCISFRGTVSVISDGGRKILVAAAVPLEVLRAVLSLSVMLRTSVVLEDGVAVLRL